jgi:hypothetical protein
MQMSEQIGEISKALAAAKAELSHATKDAKNGGFGGAKYATLSSVIDAVRPTLATHGISVMQPVSNDPAGNIVVETILMHESGQWFRESIAGRPEKPNAHGTGSIISYLRRYSLAAFVSIAQEDDDGNGSVKDKDYPNATGADVHLDPAARPKAVIKGSTQSTAPKDDPDAHEVSECRRIQAALQAAKTVDGADMAMNDPFLDYLRKAASNPENTSQFDRLAKLDAYHQKRIDIIRATPLAA